MLELFESAGSEDAALIHSDLPNSRIEMWTTRRLPFEPKGVLLAARDRLRCQMRHLSAGPDWSLDAAYFSDVRGFVDTENVLIYNVGPAAFSSASRYGLRFSREYKRPPLPSVDAPEKAWQHYHLYALERQGHEPATSIAARRFAIKLASLSSSLKPHIYWWATKEANSKSVIDENLFTGEFKLAAKIQGPLFVGNPAVILKPMFDGIISALHWDPDPDATAVERLAGSLLLDPATVFEALKSTRGAMLGGRAILAPYRRFVKWNPADELCRIGVVSQSPSDRSDWSISVEISPIV